MRRAVRAMTTMAAGLSLAAGLLGGCRAGCEATAHASEREPGRVFALERANHAWAIRSIELTDQQSARDSQELP